MYVEICRYVLLYRYMYLHNDLQMCMHMQMDGVCLHSGSCNCICQMCMGHADYPCVYVRIYVCMHACMHACMYVFMHPCMYVYMFMNLNIHIVASDLHVQAL